MPVQREDLESLLAEGASVREIAARLGVDPTTVQRWLRRYGLRPRAGELRSAHAREAAAVGAGDVTELERHCPRHGHTRFVRRRDGAYRCRRCASEAVVRRRRRVKRIMVEEAGGECAICGYGRYVGALQFHHLDPASKRFALAGAGLTRAIATVRSEAAKCVLLCANCHAEVEGGVVDLPLQLRAPESEAA